MASFLVGLAAEGGAPATAGLFGVGGSLAWTGSMMESAMPVISGVATVGKIATDVVQGQQTARNTAQWAEYNASVAARNAAQAEAEAKRNAETARIQGEQEKSEAAAEFERQQAARIVRMTASGVDLSTGSPLEQLAIARATNELNMLTLDYNHDSQVESILYGGKTTSSAYTSDANLYASKASAAKKGSAWSTGSTILTGGLNLLKDWA
ncbi:MAG: hypothetical protein AB7E47_02405 [Desulfovibrionaceae bacterium]